MRKKKDLKGCLIAVIVLMFIFVLLIGLFIGGIIYAIKNGEKVEVKWEQSDVETFYEKIGLDDNGRTLNIYDLFKGNYSITGSKDISENFSSAEISAVLNDIVEGNSVVENIAFNIIGEDTFECSANITRLGEEVYSYVPKLKKYDAFLSIASDMPLYYKGTLIYNENIGFSTDIKMVKIGHLNIPINEVKPYINKLISKLNSTIDNKKGLTIEQLKITENDIEFSGAIPEDIDRK